MIPQFSNSESAEVFHM